MNAPAISRLRVLVIAQTFPYPPDTGSRNVIYHWLRALSETHEVDLLSVDPSAEAPEEIAALPSIRIMNAGQLPGMSLRQRLVRFACSIRQGIPAASLAGMSPRSWEFVARIGNRELYDVVVLPENSTAGYVPLLRGAAPVVLYKHSVHAVDACEDRHRHGALHPRLLLEEWIVRRFEANSCRAADLVCAVNTEDAQDLQRRYRLVNPVQVIPIGVDLSIFPRRRSEPGGRVIGFVGNLSWAANKDAVSWFAHRILPKVCESFPDAVFRVIGPGGDDLQREISDPRVVFAGRVSSVAQELEAVTVGVVPVVSGTGVRFKLLEFLSVGVPAVTTSLGRLGTRCVHDKHVLVANDPEDFARAVTLLLSDGALRKRLSVEGAAIARELSWDTISVTIRHAVETAADLKENKWRR
jgi:polysaccharide biosynthesis protein PslH